MVRAIAVIRGRLVPVSTGGEEKVASTARVYRATILVTLLAAVMILPALSFGLWEPWEPKYAQAVVEMMERGDYATPFYRGAPRFSKPILPYWVIAASYSTLGVNEFATRLPFALFAIASISVFVYTLGRLFTPTLGALTGIVLLTCPMLAFMSRQAMPDTLLVANLIMAFSFLMLGLTEEPVLSKGPIALILIGSVVGLFAVMTMDFSSGLRAALAGLFRLVWKDMRVLWGVPLLLLLTAPWYAYNLYHYEQFAERLRYDYLERFTDPEGGHDGGIGYYVEALAYGLFPWTAIIPLAPLCLRIKPRRAWRDREKMQLLLLCWFLCPFLLFSTTATKFTYYIAPVIPPLAFLAATFLKSYLKGRWPARFFALSLLAVGIFMLPAREILDNQKHLLGTFTIKRTVGSAVREDGTLLDPETLFTVLFAAFIVMLMVMSALAFSRWRWLAVAGLCTVTLAFGGFNLQYLLVQLDRHKGHKYTIQAIQERMREGDRIALYFPGPDNRQHGEWSAVEASTVFYTNNQIAELGSRKQAERFFSDPNGVFCIVRDTKMRQLRRVLEKLDLKMHVIDDSHYRFTAITVRDEAVLADGGGAAGK
jgi:4-amino-4-deoxy-L-arabinose transferase-like glycosyltransferase